jgi:hypothetical protein
MNMQIPGQSSSGMSLEMIRSKLLSQFPDAHFRRDGGVDRVHGWKTGIPGIDRLFTGGAIPFGQLIEITGGMSSGKTSLILKVLSGEIQRGQVAYVDLSNMFYPDSAAASGIDLGCMLVVKPETLGEALRTTELLLKYRMAGCIVVDLVGQGGSIAVPAFHRLRTLTVRSSSTLFFLTEDNTGIIPPSMISIRFEVTRKDSKSVVVTVSRSRISVEGMRSEVPLYEP